MEGRLGLALYPIKRLPAYEILFIQQKSPILLSWFFN